VVVFHLSLVFLLSFLCLILDYGSLANGPLLLPIGRGRSRGWLVQTQERLASPLALPLERDARLLSRWIAP
jgi:hypothetical protein